MAQRRVLGKQLVKRWMDCRPPPDNQALLLELTDKVQKAAQGWTSSATAHLFGSYVSGFCKQGSDADMAVRWSTYNELHHGQHLFEEQCRKKLKLIAGSMVDNGFEKVHMVDSRTKHVSFTIPDSDVTCDITIGNDGGILNSQILRLIHDMHPIIPIYIHTVKEWAKAKEVVASAKSAFNSFTITVMALQVLQELGVLPIFSKPTGRYGGVTFEDAEKAIKEHKMPAVYATFGLSDEDQLADALTYLFQMFAQYYASFDFSLGTVSLICPRRVRKYYKENVDYLLKLWREDQRVAWEEWHRVNKAGKIDEDDFEYAVESQWKQRPDDAPIVVEDFVNLINCGRRCLAGRVKPILGEFQHLHEILSTKTDLRVEELMKKKTMFHFTMKNESALRQVTHFSKGRLDSEARF